MKGAEQKRMGITIATHHGSIAWREATSWVKNNGLYIFF